MKTIGILSQTPEAAALCFLTCCEEGAERMGPLMHPDIVLATATLGLCLPAYTAFEFEGAVPYLEKAVARLHAAGADFYVSASNSPHGAIGLFAGKAPIPCLHVADAVTAEIRRSGWNRVGLLGSRATMTGTFYRDAFRRAGVEKLIPEAAVHDRCDEIIFQEVSRGHLLERSRLELIAEIAKLEDRGAQCVIVGRAELPVLLIPNQSPLPILESTRVLAKAAVEVALSDGPLLSTDGWVRPSRA